VIRADIHLLAQRGVSRRASYRLLKSKATTWSRRPASVGR